METKYATEELEKGKEIQARFQARKKNIEDFFVVSDKLCYLPADYTAEEEQQNPIGACRVPYLQPPTLLVMKYGGVALDTFRMTETHEILSFSKACVGILEKLRTFHKLGMVHLDLKPANLVVQIKNNKYDIRMIDVGFVQFLDKLNPSVLRDSKGFSHNYVIWPFETRYLRDPLVSPTNEEINLFYANCVELLTRSLGRRTAYIDPISHTPTLLHGSPRLIDKYLTYYLSIPEPLRYAEIARKTDIYSMGFTLMKIFQKCIFSMFAKNAVLTWLTEQLYTDVVEPMMHPDPSQRSDIDTACEAMKRFNTKFQAMLEPQPAPEPVPQPAPQPAPQPDAMQENNGSEYGPWEIPPQWQY